MWDIICMVACVAFFLLSAAYIAGCEGLEPKSPKNPENPKETR